MKKIDNALKIETLNALYLKYGDEALREALYFFMPLHAVTKAVPIDKHHCIKGVWLKTCTSRNFSIVEKYIQRISLTTLEELVSHIR